MTTNQGDNVIGRLLDWIMEELSDALDRDVCQTCARPNMSLRHRRRCLRNSEEEIFEILKKNREADE